MELHKYKNAPCKVFCGDNDVCKHLSQFLQVCNSICRHIGAFIIFRRGLFSFYLNFSIFLSKGIEPRRNRYNFQVVLLYIESKCWRQKWTRQNTVKGWKQKPFD